jgi:nitrate/nitrite transporter NarK
MTGLFTWLGGRKMTLSLAGLVAIVCLAYFKATPEAYLPVALIVASFAGANGWVESAYAGKKPLA